MIFILESIEDHKTTFNSSDKTIVQILLLHILLVLQNMLIYRTIDILTNDKLISEMKNLNTLDSCSINKCAHIYSNDEKITKNNVIKTNKSRFWMRFRLKRNNERKASSHSDRIEEFKG